jgi:hypothetical protein
MLYIYIERKHANLQKYCGKKVKRVLTIESVSLAGCRRIFLLSKIWEGHLRLRSLKIGKKT